LLNQVGLLLDTKARYSEAEPLYRRALAIDEQSYGIEHTIVAIRLNNLAQLLQATNRLAEAEPLMRRALAIDGIFSSDSTVRATPDG
jgi:tetratricopeptide (TPR) repeat protein